MRSRRQCIGRELRHKIGESGQRIGFVACPCLHQRPPELRLRAERTVRRKTGQPFVVGHRGIRPVRLLFRQMGHEQIHLRPQRRIREGLTEFTEQLLRLGRLAGLRPGLRHQQHAGVGLRTLRIGRQDPAHRRLRRHQVGQLQARPQ